MNQLARPVTEWGAPGAYTRSKKLIPHKVPGTMGEYSSRRRERARHTRANLYRIRWWAAERAVYKERRGTRQVGALLRRFGRRKGSEGTDGELERRGWRTARFGRV